MSGLTDALWITGSYIVAFALIYLVFNFLTKGFFHNYLKVFGSRGRLTFVEAHDVTDTYYKAGKIDSKRNLILKDRYGKTHTFNKIQNAFIQRRLGVNCISVDLVNGLIIERNYSGASTFDLTLTSDLIDRALMLPRINKNEKIEKIFMWLLLVGIAIGVVACVYLLMTQEPATAVCKVSEMGGVNI